METVMEHPERWASALGGAALVVWGAQKLSRERRPVGALLATTGAGLIWRSARTDTRARLAGPRGTLVEESVAINRAPEDLYAFWRNLERLPTVMPQLASVESAGDRRSHWVANAPARWRTEWYAELINDIPSQLIPGEPSRDRIWSAPARCISSRDRWGAGRSCASGCNTILPAARWGRRWPGSLATNRRKCCAKRCGASSS